MNTSPKRRPRLCRLCGAPRHDNDIDDSSVKSGDEQELNLALIARVEEGTFTIDINRISARKNISDNKTIELLRNIVMSKNKELETQQQVSMSTSPFGKNKVFINLFYDSDDYDFDERHTMVDSSSSLCIGIKCQNYDRLQSMLVKQIKLYS
jgi:hypothetical protein